MYINISASSARMLCFHAISVVQQASQYNGVAGHLCASIGSSQARIMSVSLAPQMDSTSRWNGNLTAGSKKTLCNVEEVTNKTFLSTSGSIGCTILQSLALCTLVRVVTFQRKMTGATFQRKMTGATFQRKMTSGAYET